MKTLKTTKIILLLVATLVLSCSKDDEAITPEPELNATSIEIVSGNNQYGEMGATLANPIEVLVKDQNGNPFSGATVNFGVSDGSVSTATATTDATGIASVIWTLTSSSLELQTLNITAFANDGITVLTGSPITVIATPTSGGYLVQYNSTPQAVGVSATTTNSTISIFADFLINAVEVVIDIDHSYVSDLDIYLVAPNGTEVALSTGNGASGNNYTNTIFSASATTSIMDGVAPFNGTYLPEGDLSSFNGMQSAGEWTLKIDDTYLADDSGQLISWGIAIGN